MPTHFALTLPGETVFGNGRLSDLPTLARRYGVRAVVARGGASAEQSGLLARLRALLTAAGVTGIELPAQRREPEIDDVDAAVAVARRAGAQLVIAAGGGSVLDLGKAVAALAPQQADVSVRAYLEGLGDGRTLHADPLPLIAIPTTAGTGTEATKNAVISSKADGVKKSLRDRRMMADVALIDPELTLQLPPHLTAWSGLDAMTQLIEAYTTHKAQPVTDALALRGLAAVRALPAAYHTGEDLAAREQVSLAAYLSGVCLANAGLGAAHGIAAALGSEAGLAHGLACALALPWVMTFNLPVARERYAQMAETLLGGSFPATETAARALIMHIRQLLEAFHIPRAADLPAVANALREDNLPVLAARCHGNSLRGNPRSMTDDDLIAVLRAMRDSATTDDM